MIGRKERRKGEHGRLGKAKGTHTVSYRSSSTAVLASIYPRRLESQGLIRRTLRRCWVRGRERRGKGGRLNQFCCRHIGCCKQDQRRWSVWENRGEEGGNGDGRVKGGREPLDVFSMVFHDYVDEVVYGCWGLIVSLGVFLGRAERCEIARIRGGKTHHFHL